MATITSIAGIAATAAVVLMVLVMLTFVRTAMGQEAHQPGTGESDSA